MRTSAFCILLFTGFLVCASGCGNSGPTLQIVAGTVTLNGKPLQAGEIYLHPEGGTPAAGAWNGLVSGGRYSVNAPTGKYKVTIGVNAAAEQPQAAIDAKYSHVSKTPLAVDVVASPGAGAYDLKLTK